MAQIEIDVEETAKFIQKNTAILVVKRGDKRFYMRVQVTNDKNYPYELIPLSSSELKKIGIEESYQNDPNQDEIETEIEESAQGETEDPTKKVHNIDLSKPEDIARAQKILDAAEAKTKASMEKKAEEKKESSLSDKKIELSKSFNDKRFLDAENETELKEMVRDVVKEAQDIKTGKPEGSAPMNKFQLGEKETDLLHEKFESPKSMVEKLQLLAHQGNSEAQDYLDSMLEKWKISKRNATQPDPVYDPNAPENLPNLVRKGDLVTPSDPKDGDLARIIENQRLLNPRVRMARRAMQEGANPNSKEQ